MSEEVLAKVIPSSMPLFIIATYITLFGQGVTRALNALFNGLLSCTVSL